MELVEINQISCAFSHQSSKIYTKTAKKQNDARNASIEYGTSYTSNGQLKIK